MDIKKFALKYFDIKLTRHQMKWFKFINEPGKRKILLAPRGHGKTTFINLIYPSWVIANDPLIHILIISHSREMAESFSLSIRNVFERKDIQDDFGIEPGSPWRANSWQLKGSKHDKPTIRVVGARGKIAGWRGEMIIFDDLIDVDSVTSEAMRRRLKHWIDYDVLPTLNPDPRQKVIVIGTRKHVFDWYSELLDNKYYAKKIDKVWDPINHRPLWKEKFTKEYIEQIRAEQGSLVFAQEYMNEPVPPEGLELNIDWIKYYELMPNYPMKYYIGIDPSSGKTTDRSQSYFAIVCVAYDQIKDNIYVIDMYRGKLSKREQIMKSEDFINRYTPELIFVESVFEYTFVYEALKHNYRNVKDIDYVHTQMKGVNVVKKEERIKNVTAPAFEMGRIYLPKSENNPMTRTFIEEEYIPFPTGSMDLLDAMTLAIHTLTKRKITTIPFYFPR